MLQECLVVAGVDDHSSLTIALNKYKNQELRLEEVANADEELTEHQLKQKDLKEKKKQAVEGLIRTDSRFGCVRNKHKDNKRQRWKNNNKNNISCLVSLCMTSRHRLLNAYGSAIKFKYMKYVSHMFPAWKCNEVSCVIIMLWTY